MSKKRRSQLATAGILAGVLCLILAQRNRVPAAASAGQEPQPRDVIYSMHDAARAGDVSLYLGCFTGKMAESLRVSAREASLADYLKRANREIKGIAIQEPQRLTDREVRVRVEYVYADRNEAQAMYLERTTAGWKIARVDGMERIPTVVPYGTPVQ